MANPFGNLAGQLRRRWLYGLMSVLVTVTLVVGHPQPSQAVPRWLDLLFRGVQILQLSNISDRQEVSLGQQINQQLVGQQFRLYNDRAITNYVNDVGQRLVPYSDRPNIPYTFQVVDSSQINAFATMGGFVYVTTGLLRAADNEAELASVISHEIGHIAKRHSIQQMRERAVTAGVATAAGLDRNTAVAIGVELALNRPNSRRDELEADSAGLQTLRDAGYAPGAMLAFLNKLRTRGSIPTFLSTHPATSDRIERLSAQIDPATANVGAGLDGSDYQSRMSRLPRAQ